VNIKGTFGKLGSFAAGRGKLAAAGIIATGLAVGGIGFGASADAADTTTATGLSCTGCVWQTQIADPVEKILRTPAENTVWTKALNDNIVSENKLSPTVREKLNKVGGPQGPAGPAGPEGPAGPQGEAGAAGTDGVSGLSVNGPTKVVPTGFSEIELNCPEGKKALSGGLKWDSGAKSEAKSVVLNGSYPSDLAEVEGVSSATSWTVALTNNAPNEITVQPFVTCASVG
jgi:hypothetical protein